MLILQPAAWRAPAAAVYHAVSRSRSSRLTFSMSNWIPQKRLSRHSWTSARTARARAAVSASSRRNAGWLKPSFTTRGMTLTPCEVHHAPIDAAPHDTQAVHRVDLRPQDRDLVDVLHQAGVAVLGIHVIEQPLERLLRPRPTRRERDHDTPHHDAAAHAAPRSPPSSVSPAVTLPARRPDVFFSYVAPWRAGPPGERPGRRARAPDGARPDRGPARPRAHPHRRGRRPRDGGPRLLRARSRHGQHPARDLPRADPPPSGGRGGLLPGRHLQPRRVLPDAAGQPPQLPALHVGEPLRPREHPAGA